MSRRRTDESLQVRYARRGPLDRYGLLQPDVWHLVQERQRQILRGLAARGWAPERLRVTEVGCGAGGNLLEWLRAGCLPEHLSGCELLPERLAMARRVLPASLILHGGDAGLAPIADASQDIVMQATVFSSILDDDQQHRLAQTMWRWLRPGGVVLWYDFTMDNPRNPDVRGMPLARVRQLFPDAHIDAQRITLAPPLARRVCAVHPSLYPLLNAVPWLRSHCLAWLTKR